MRIYLFLLLICLSLNLSSMQLSLASLLPNEILIIILKNFHKEHKIFFNEEYNSIPDIYLVSKSFSSFAKASVICLKMDAFTLKYSSKKESFFEYIKSHYKGLNEVQLMGSRKKIISGIGSFIKLKSLVINRGNVEEDFIHLSKLTNLEQLALRNCKRIDDDCLVHLSNFVKLKSIEFYNCSLITDEVIDYLSNLSNLQNIQFLLCKITGQRLNCLTSITKMDLSCCYKLNSQGFNNLGKLTKLRSLNLSDIYDLIDDNLKNFTTLINLKEIYLLDCEGITMQGLKYLSNLTQLKILTNLEDEDSDLGIAGH